MRVRIDTIKNNSETALKVAVLYTHTHTHTHTHI